MAGIFWGCVLSPLVVIVAVLAQSPDGGYDPSTWAWIDVVGEKIYFSSMNSTGKL